MQFIKSPDTNTRSIPIVYEGGLRFAGDVRYPKGVRKVMFQNPCFFEGMSGGGWG